MPRIASNVLVSALIRTTEQNGGSGYVTSRGSDMSGAIFVTFYDHEKRDYDLYEPASQALVPDEEGARNIRYFTLFATGLNSVEISERFEKERKFDPDFWVVEVEGIKPEQLGEVFQTV